MKSITAKLFAVCLLLCLMLSACAGQGTSAPTAEPASSAGFSFRTDLFEPITDPTHAAVFQAVSAQSTEAQAAVPQLVREYPRQMTETEHILLTVCKESYNGAYEKEREFTGKEQVDAVVHGLKALRLMSSGKPDLSVLEPVIYLTVAGSDEKTGVTLYTGLMRTIAAMTVNGCITTNTYPGIIKITDLLTKKSQVYEISEEQMSSFCTLLRNLYSSE